MAVFRSLVSAMKMIACASASTLETTGSDTSSGRRPRTRLTRSRTSLAASSGSTVSRKWTVMRLDSGRERLSSTSTPPMPAMEPSRTWVTCDSMISALAPG